MYDKIDHTEDLKKVYDKQINAFNKGERGFIVHMRIEYEWNNKTYNSREYTIIHNKDELILD